MSKIKFGRAVACRQGHLWDGDACVTCGVGRRGTELRYRQEFTRYVKKTATCWLWIGGTFHNGYGRCDPYWGTRRAHVVTYTQANGPIPDGLEIDHLCRVPNCVNPNHMEAVTHAVNIARKPQVCAKGHSLTGNRFFSGKKKPGGGYSRCLTCYRAYLEARKEKRG